MIVSGCGHHFLFLPVIASNSPASTACSSSDMALSSNLHARAVPERGCHVDLPKRDRKYPPGLLRTTRGKGRALRNG